MIFRRASRLLLALAIVLLPAYAFLLGPLFPWSPLKLRYEGLRSQRADVFFGRGTPLEQAYRRLDQDIELTEKFHQLRLPHRMTIIVCRDWGDFHRFLPTVRGEGLGAATPEYGTVIFITPRVHQINADPTEYLRHELSHAILHQNTTLWKGFQFKKAPWLVEGLAVLAAEQSTYGTWEDFARNALVDDLEPFFLGETWKQRGFNIRFAYLAWRYFLAWTIETRGGSLFQKLLLGFLKRPAEVEQVFQEIYGENLRVAISNFGTTVRAGRWRPK